MLIPVDKIVPNPEQPRKEFDYNDLVKLAQSIARHGLINPIAVEEAGDIYMIIDGERRWRAAMLAGLTSIEASVRPGMNGNGARDRLVMGIVGNVQRQDMNPIDQALAFKRLVEMGYTIEMIGTMLSLHESNIRKYLYILDFPVEIQELYRQRKIALDNRCIHDLRSIEDKNLQIRVAELAAERGLGGNQISVLIKRMHFAGRKRSHHKEHESKINRKYEGHWNMVAQAAVMKPGEKIIVPVDHVKLLDDAIATCKECALYDIASRINCRDCPAVGLLKRLCGG